MLSRAAVVRTSLLSTPVMNPPMGGADLVQTERHRRTGHEGKSFMAPTAVAVFTGDDRGVKVDFVRSDRGMVWGANHNLEAWQAPVGRSPAGHTGE